MPGTSQMEAWCCHPSASRYRPIDLDFMPAMATKYEADKMIYEGFQGLLPRRVLGWRSVKACANDILS